MKRLLLFVLIFNLVGCNMQDDSSYTDEIELLRDEIDILMDENNKLNDIVIELETLMELNKRDIDELSKTNAEVEQKLNILDEYRIEVQELRTLAYRLKRYISRIPNYSEITCYINEYDIDNDILMIDEFEWIKMDDYERIEDLELDLRYDFPNPYYIYNDEEKAESYYLPKDTDFYILDSTRFNYANKEMFAERLEGHLGLFRVVLIDNNIVEVSEIYVP